MIPPEIQDYETYIVSYSGGKDSTATLLWALDNLPRERLRAVFCDTGAEWPETYDYLSYIEQQTHQPIQRISNGDKTLPSGSIERQTWASAPTLLKMVRQRGMWPSARVRYCTKYLKMWPLRLQVTPNSVILLGERAQENKRRASLKQFSATGFHQAPIYRPVLAWSERQVWNYLHAHHIFPNPIYNHITRCGCWCCILARPVHLLNFCRLHPHIAQKAADLKQEIGHNWRPQHSITNLLRQAQAQIPLFDTQPRFTTPLSKFNRTASDAAGTTPAAPPATPLAGRQRVRQQKEPL